MRLATTPLDGRAVRVAMCVHNTTRSPEGLDRAAALRSSLRSTHLVAHAPGGRFASPISPGPTAAAAVARVRPREHLPGAGDADTTTRCSARRSCCPDHPQIAPESHGDLFDATEIEEALLLHVLALSDGERAQIAEQDPKVREMLARAEADGPEAIARLHGRVTVTRSAAGAPARARPTCAGEAAIDRRRRHVPARRQGAPAARLRRGAAGRRAGPAAWRRSSGSTATTRTASTSRVTVDDDPGQELMRDIGRYLYFKPAEVEVVGA